MPKMLRLLKNAAFFLIGYAQIPIMAGHFLMGDSLPMALDRATRYTELTIKTTFGFSTDSREGVMLERTLEWLTHREVPQRYRPL